MNYSRDRNNVLHLIDNMRAEQANKMLKKELWDQTQLMLAEQEKPTSFLGCLPASELQKVYDIVLHLKYGLGYGVECLAKGQ